MSKKTKAIEKYVTDFNNENTRVILELVRHERARQRQLLAEGKIHFDCASAVVKNTFKLPVLLEEVGEVSKEMQDWMDPHDPASEACRERMQKELIQVAAVAVAWAESLEAA